MRVTIRASLSYNFKPLKLNWACVGFDHYNEGESACSGMIKAT